MNEQTTTNEQAVTPESPVTAPQSLADYRAWRDKPAAERTAPAEVETPAQAEPTDDDPEGEATEDSETSETTEQQGTEGETKPATKKGGFQRTIDKLRSELEEVKGKLAGQPATAATETKPAATPAQAPNAPQFAEAEPQLEDFENIAEYTKALLKWDRARTSFEQTQEQARQKQADSQKTILDQWKSHEADAKKLHSDYDAALAKVSDVKIPPAHQHALLESELGPQVAYHLAKHPEELKAFVAMTPFAAARAIGKIEAALTASEPATSQKPRVSNAPAPIRTIAGKAPAISFDVSKASLAEYRKARAEGRVA